MTVIRRGNNAIIEDPDPAFGPQPIQDYCRSEDGASVIEKLAVIYASGHLDVHALTDGGQNTVVFSMDLLCEPSKFGKYRGRLTIKAKAPIVGPFHHGYDAQPGYASLLLTVNGVNSTVDGVVYVPWTDGRLTVHGLKAFIEQRNMQDYVFNWADAGILGERYWVITLLKELALQHLVSYKAESDVQEVAKRVWPNFATSEGLFPRFVQIPPPTPAAEGMDFSHALHDGMDLDIGPDEEMKQAAKRQRR